MHDIRLAMALVAFSSIAVFAVSYRLLKSRSKTFLDIMAVIIVILIGVYVQTVWDQLWIVNWISLPSVIVLANWFPPLLFALAATVWLRLRDLTVGRRLPVMGLMLGAAIYSVVYYIPAEPPECGDDWDQPFPPMIWPVCLQTTPFTCSAAAAATILNALEIPSSEQEMARLCLTQSGTTWLGLYHGLSTKLLGTKHRIEFFESDVSDLERIAETHPVLLCCQLDAGVAELIPEYVRQGGWIPGTAHSVVYFGVVNGSHIIGDPSRGYEAWESRDLNLLWTGTGLKVGDYDDDGNHAHNGDHTKR